MFHKIFIQESRNSVKYLFISPPLGVNYFTPPLGVNKEAKKVFFYV